MVQKRIDVMALDVWDEVEGYLYAYLRQGYFGRIPRCLEAEDIIAFGFLGVREAAVKYDKEKTNGGTFKTFAVSKAKWRVLDELRKIRKQRNKDYVKGECFSFISLEDIWGMESDGNINAVESRIDVGILLAELKNKERYIIDRYYLTEDTATLDEIAKELGICESGVSQHKMRILNILSTM